ncbi:uncharacterized protein MKK02DRAFT_39243 [Dioszegia hungarica]|uniref:NADH dehydrogenase [ubiquinone] 1 alpha subcomplex subunit 1 n=1 Tax=Dioszegia hungarica TaxID=4972 RepID=A0AA38H372_9TREE|nr:uncharacterized protein MKK02DRAFT_39243 [Dioszegia hungarica]KAI9633265.1 hypothetical protein MKK02DRAFT_39243 [Dioszegia hungarica]
MPVPFEALLPFALLTVCFGATGTLFSIAKRATNDGKVGYFFEEYEENQWELARRRNSMNLPPRYHIDSWETMMMERDRRLTGSLRGQSTNPTAPKEFATNSVWETERVH